MRCTHAFCLEDTAGISQPASCTWMYFLPERQSSPSPACSRPPPTTSLSTPSMPWGRVAMLTTMQYLPSPPRVSLESPQLDTGRTGPHKHPLVHHRFLKSLCSSPGFSVVSLQRGPRPKTTPQTRTPRVSLLP